MALHGGEWGPLRKRPYSDIKPPPDHPSVRKHNRRQSTGNIPNFTGLQHHNSRYSPAEASALADFQFFQDDVAPAISQSVSWAMVPADPYRIQYAQYLIKNVSTADSIDSPPSLTHTLENGRLSFTGLTHPSGSPVLQRELVSDADHPIHIDKRLSTRSKQGPEYCFSDKVEHILDNDEDDHVTAGTEYPTYKGTLPALRTSVITHPEEDPAVSIAKQLTQTNQAVTQTGGSAKPEIVDINQNKTERIQPSIVREQPAHEAESARMSGRPTVVSKTAPKLLENSSISDIGPSPEDSVGNSISAQPELRLSSCEDMPYGSSRSPSIDPSLTTLSNETSLEDTVAWARPQSVADPQSVPPAPSMRPASPPLHRPEPSRVRLEPKDREHWTLYDLSYRFDKTYLRALLKGPTLEFRSDPEALPFLQNVSQEMLKHFCGEDHVARLIEEFGLPFDHVEQEKGILVFPESLINPTAIMRIVRYMRRCCARTTAMTKPQFQLHAPHALEATIETVRACNIFGLYADARRLQNFLTNKRIPGGKLTMEDVEIIWEGYDGGLRDSVYTDALLTHIVYNVLGSDNVDREDLLVLLGQEEFTGLREMVGYELGVKKRKAEEKEDFMMRKQSERAEIDKQANGGKQLTKLSASQATRGPTVQGRLLRVLSQDALMAIDPTVEKRYKTRPSMRRPVSTPDLGKDPGQLESAGYLYQNALREIQEHASLPKSHIPNHNIQKAEEKQMVSLDMIREQVQARPSAPTPTGRKRELESRIHESDYYLPNRDSQPASNDTGKQDASISTSRPTAQIQSSATESSQQSHMNYPRSSVPRTLAERPKMVQNSLQAKNKMPKMLKQLWGEVRDRI